MKSNRIASIIIKSNRIVSYVNRSRPSNECNNEQLSDHSCLKIHDT